MPDPIARHLEVLADALATPGKGSDECTYCEGERFWVVPDSHARGRIVACPACVRDRSEER